MKLASLACAALAAFLIPAHGRAQAPATGVDRLYILDCGNAHAPDQSRWSPGVNVGVPIDVSDNCYLIHNTQGYLLWDTGVTDKIFGSPPGSGPIPWQRSKTLIEQLAALGVKPTDLRYIAVSHIHPDHVGNVDLFPTVTLLIQRADFDYAMAQKTPPFNGDRPVMKLEGDYDVFGDRSVRLVATPGHTPGHESLLVHLPNTGWVLLSGDAVHFKDNWDNRRVPAGNTDKEATLSSMQHIADLIGQYHAQLWINHDAAQSKTMRYAPQFYD
jgi:N-acyl homoserine lactone hydrolase